MKRHASKKVKKDEEESKENHCSVQQACFGMHKLHNRGDGILDFVSPTCSDPDT
jgi:hypothetical protein